MTSLANHPAVRARIITEEQAFCGMQETALMLLAQHMPNAVVIVRRRDQSALRLQARTAYAMLRANHPDMASVRNVILASEG